MFTQPSHPWKWEHAVCRLLVRRKRVKRTITSYCVNPFPFFSFYAKQSDWKIFENFQYWSLNPFASNIGYFFLTTSILSREDLIIRITDTRRRMRTKKFWSRSVGGFVTFLMRIRIQLRIRLLSSVTLRMQNNYFFAYFFLITYPQAHYLQS